MTSTVCSSIRNRRSVSSRLPVDHEFLKQFLNSKGSFEVVTGAPDAFSGATGTVTETTGDTVEVDALTGATVTSKAIVRAVNSAVAYVTGADVASSATTWGG